MGSSNQRLDETSRSDMTDSTIARSFTARTCLPCDFIVIIIIIIIVVVATPTQTTTETACDVL